MTWKLQKKQFEYEVAEPNPFEFEARETAKAYGKEYLKPYSVAKTIPRSFLKVTALRY